MVLLLFSSSRCLHGSDVERRHSWKAKYVRSCAGGCVDRGPVHTPPPAPLRLRARSPLPLPLLYLIHSTLAAPAAPRFYTFSNCVVHGADFPYFPRPGLEPRILPPPPPTGAQVDAPSGGPETPHGAGDAQAGGWAPRGNPQGVTPRGVTPRPRPQGTIPPQRACAASAASRRGSSRGLCARVRGGRDIGMHGAAAQHCLGRLAPRSHAEPLPHPQGQSITLVPRGQRGPGGQVALWQRWDQEHRPPPQTVPGKPGPACPRGADSAAPGGPGCVAPLPRACRCPDARAEAAAAAAAVREASDVAQARRGGMVPWGLGLGVTPRGVNPWGLPAVPTRLPARHLLRAASRALRWGASTCAPVAGRLEPVECVCCPMLCCGGWGWVGLG
eukprot:gene22940-biopygen19287